MPSLKNTWAFIKRNPKKSIVLPILLYAIMGLITAANSTTGEVRDDCVETTKVLDGGIHNFNGKDYLFTLCGQLNSRFVDTIDNIRLQIHDDKNELWVERFFDVYMGSSSGLSYHESSIFYFGADDDGVLGGEIKMPPSRWEWIKVRVKHAFWRGMEFIFVKPVEWVFSS